MTNSPLVLIVEDSPSQAKQLAHELSERGVRTIIADDGPDGLRAVDEFQPDLIVLDIILPTMDGYQICRRLKRDEDTMHIPIIMLTASDDFDAILQILENGADDYIAKDVFAVKNVISSLQTFGLLDTE